ncbi:MAG: type 1 glutamine amidotransferase [Nitrospirae bacterium]|nr:type 1 glutamine amidotransferase [Nitrospirota bacterium]
MRLHYLQHVPFEDLANIETWAKSKLYRVSGTSLFNDEPLPKINDFDWLIILGGPMNIYEEGKYPWLVKEKEFLEKAIAQKKIIMGICLGAQLIADVLGGSVCKNTYKEIGWFPVSLTPEAKKLSIFNASPGSFTAFHWHCDTFDLPPEAIRIAESDGCANQAFAYNGGRVMGLQFHLESSRESINRLIQNCGDEIVKGKYIQNPDEILSQCSQGQETNRIMAMLLNAMAKEFG